MDKVRYDHAVLPFLEQRQWMTTATQAGRTICGLLSSVQAFLLKHVKAIDCGCHCCVSGAEDA